MRIFKFNVSKWKILKYNGSKVTLSYWKTKMVLMRNEEWGMIVEKIINVKLKS